MDSYHVLCPLSSVEQRILRFSLWLPPTRMEFFLWFRGKIYRTCTYGRQNLKENEVSRTLPAQPKIDFRQSLATAHPCSAQQPAFQNGKTSEKKKSMS